MKIIKVCANCKHKCISFGTPKDDWYVKLSDTDGSSLGEMFGCCETGNIETLINFYKEHGNSPKESYQDIVYPCFKHTDFNNSMNQIMILCDEILEEKNLTELVGKVFSFTLPNKNANGCRLLKDEDAFVTRVLAIVGCNEVNGPTLCGSYIISFDLQNVLLSDDEIIQQIDTIAKEIGFEN